jgi:hypothetical protein
MEEGMFKQSVGTQSACFSQPPSASFSVARSGQLDELVALEQLGSRRSFARDEEIYAEGDRSDCWFKVVSGTVRICKLMADGRRHPPRPDGRGSSGNPGTRHNPLLADASGVIAADARIRIAEAPLASAARLAIAPYPKHLESVGAARDGTPITLRPCGPRTSRGCRSSSLI